MAAPVLLTAAQYFAVDDISETKYELVDGVLYSMAGGTPDHAQISLAIGIVLGPQLRGKPCRPYGSELRVALSNRTYAYPDASIICGKREIAEEDPNTVVNPTVVFEVLSPSTESYDRGRKRALYQRIPSMRTVVLIASEEAWVEVYERQSEGEWTVREYSGLDRTVPLPAIDAEMPLADLYDGIEFRA
jgi:Uma2 family endonuclease